MTKNEKRIGVFLVCGILILGLFNFSVVEAAETEYKQIGYIDLRYALNYRISNFIENTYETAFNSLKKEFEEKQIALDLWFKQENELLSNSENYDDELVILNKHYEEKYNQLDMEYENKLMLLEEQKKTDERMINTYQVYTQEQLDHVKNLDSEWLTPYPNLSGIENMPNLKSINGEHNYAATDIRQFNALNNLEELSIALANNPNLNDLKNHKNLSFLRINVVNDEDTTNRTPLTDISVLSDLKKLTTIKIDTEGTLNTVTLKKGTKSYYLYEPIILSNQFENSTMKYISFIDNDNNNEFTSTDEVRWDNLTGDEKYLSFSWSINAGNNMYYGGTARIPVRWK